MRSKRKKNTHARESMFVEWDVYFMDKTMPSWWLTSINTLFYLYDTGFFLRQKKTQNFLQKKVELGALYSLDFLETSSFYDRWALLGHSPQLNTPNFLLNEWTLLDQLTNHLCCLKPPNFFEIERSRIFVICCSHYVRTISVRNSRNGFSYKPAIVELVNVARARRQVFERGHSTSAVGKRLKFVLCMCHMDWRNGYSLILSSHTRNRRTMGLSYRSIPNESTTTTTTTMAMLMMCVGAYV